MFNNTHDRFNTFRNIGFQRTPLLISMRWHFMPAPGVSLVTQTLDKIGLSITSLGSRAQCWGGGQMAHRRKSAILAIFLYSKHTNSCPGTQWTQELPPTGSKASHGHSLGLTGSFERTLWFSRFCKAVFTFSKKEAFILSLVEQPG